MARFGSKSLVVFITLLLGVLPAAAQSFYSQQGVGLVRHFVSGQSAGMGGAGLAIADPLALNYMNPAALTNLAVTYVSGNFLHQSNTLKGAGNDAAISDTNVDGFQLHLPLKSLRASAALGLMPYSSIEYGFEGEGSVAGTRFRQLVSGDGGISTAFLSLAVRPFSRLSVGVTGLYYFGNLRRQWRVLFLNQSPSDPNRLLNARDEVTEHFSDANVRLGMQFSVTPKWRVAAVFTPAISLSAKKTVVLLGIRQFTDFPDRTVELPLSYGLGTSLFLGKKLLVAADYYSERWSKTGSSSYPNDSKRIALGFEFSGRGTSFTSSFFSRSSVRAGISYRDLGIEQPTGQKVTELFGSVGLGIPIKWRAARLDMAFEVGQRGSLPDNPIRERIVRVAVTITAGERWFYRGGPK